MVVHHLVIRETDYSRIELV